MKAGWISQFITLTLFALDSTPWYLRIGILILVVMGFQLLTSEILAF